MNDLFWMWGFSTVVFGLSSLVLGIVEGIKILREHRKRFPEREKQMMEVNFINGLGAQTKYIPLDSYNELMELMLEDKPIGEELIHKIVREQTIAREITPVLMGSAFKNRGVQLLLDAVTRYLPSPLDRIAYAKDNENEGAETAISADPDGPTVAMAFKIVDESFGQLTFSSNPW